MTNFGLAHHTYCMKSFKLEEIIRKNILNILPYSSARDDYSGQEGVFLDANENPLGSVGGGEFNRYPDPYQRDLKQKIARIKQVDAENIFLGNGSDEPIDLLFRIFCNPGKDNVVICPPTYGMYKVSASVNDIEVKTALLTEKYQLDVPGILNTIDQNTKIVFVCSPNNPTGNALNPDDIKQLLNEFKTGIVLIDEAYIDFTDQESWNQYLDLYPNLVVIQTFSKAWGLAGIRLGMAFASKEIIAYFNKIKYPYNISQATLNVALNALENVDQKFDFVDKIIQERERLFILLDEMESVYRVVPSDSNSLLFFIDNATEVYNKLCENKVIIRDRSKVALCEGGLRVSIGTKAENDTFIMSLKGLIG